MGPSKGYRLASPRMQYPPDAETSTVPLQACPVKASMGALSKKWSLMIIRDIVFYKLDRFNQFLKNNPGLTPRTLSLRLGQLVEEGFLERVDDRAGVRYRLDAKGEDVKPILLAFLAFGIKHHAVEVFEDARPRGLAEAFPQFTGEYVKRLYGLP